jgi:hypothetical protein
MTFDELDTRFANGFDDARITAVTVDYGARRTTFQLDLRGSSPDSPDRDVYASAVLTAREIYYLSIEPPAPDQIFAPGGDWIVVDGIPEDPHHFPLFAHLQPKLRPGAFCCRFCVHDWNSFIHVAAAEADFSWAPTK